MANEKETATTSESDQHTSAHDVKAVNDVDVSDELINNEWENIARDEGVSLNEADTPTEFDVHPDDETQQRDQAVPRVAGLLEYAFSLGFVFFAPAWRVAADEISRLATVWARVAAKYLPVSWLRYAPDVSGGEGSECIECDALAVTFQVIGPRLGQPLQEISETTPQPATGPDIPENSRNHAAAVSEKVRNTAQPDAMRDVHGEV